MAGKVKVYGWQGNRGDASRWNKERGRGGDGATREIVAASSVSEVRRLTGATMAELFNLCPTGNQSEIVTALAEPGVVFWRPIDDRGNWRRDG